MTSNATSKQDKEHGKCKPKWKRVETMMYDRVPPCYGSTSRWRGVSFTTKVNSTPQRPHPILRWTPPQRPSSPSTMESFKAESGALTTSLRHTPTTELGALKHTTNLLQQQHTSKNQECTGFLHKETLSNKSLKWMRGKWRMAWWRCRSGASPSILQRWAWLGGGIGRSWGFGELLNVDLELHWMLDELTLERRRRGLFIG